MENLKPHQLQQNKHGLFSISLQTQELDQITLGTVHQFTITGAGSWALAKCSQVTGQLRPNHENKCIAGHSCEVPQINLNLFLPPLQSSSLLLKAESLSNQERISLLKDSLAVGERLLSQKYQPFVHGKDRLPVCILFMYFGFYLILKKVEQLARASCREFHLLQARQKLWINSKNREPKRISQHAHTPQALPLCRRSSLASI